MMLCLDDSVLSFLPFVNERRQVKHELDEVSDKIYIPNGLPFGTQTHTVAYVSYECMYINFIVMFLGWNKWSDLF